MFHATYDEGSPDVYAGQEVVDLTGPLDAAVLKASFETVVDRHEILRASFQRRGSGTPVQLIARRAALPWREADLSGLDGDAATAEAHRLADEERERRFALDVPPLIRVLLVRFGPERHRLVVTLHHIILDGWSLPLLRQEWWASYQAGGTAAGMPPVTPYREYLEWLAGRDRDAARDAWRAALAGVDEPTLVAPAAADTPPGESGEVVVRTGERLAAALRELARARGLTLNTVVQGAWALLVAKATGRRDVVFGSTVAGRPAELPGVERMLGLFLNTVPVRVRLDPALPVGDLLAEVQQRQSTLVDHSYLGLSEIQRLAGGGASFDTLMSFANYPVGPSGPQAGARALTLNVAAVRDAAHYPLTLVVAPTDDLELRLKHRADVFTPAEVEVLGGRLVRVLEQFAADPGRPVGRIEVLDENERRTVLADWNATAADVPTATLPALFEERVATAPDAPAVVGADGVWTYAALDREANRVAHELIARGVGPGDIVAVVLGRSPALVAALLGAVKAGAAYLSIDRNYPAERIAFILADARPKLVLCSTETEPVLPADLGAETVRVLLDDPEVAAQITGRSDVGPSDADRRLPLNVRHPAYVIYTSGSTGVPKGTIVTHEGIGNMACHQREQFGGGPGKRVLQLASLSFDAAFWELTMALLTGAALITAEGDRSGAHGAFAELAERFGATHAIVPPSVLAAVEDLPESLEFIASGGEACPPALVARWAPGRRMMNLYGPTEATVYVSATGALDADADKPVPIGRPITNTRLFVLDEFLRPVPPGVPGDLYAAGPGLARGYLGRHALTAERFVACPFAARGGERMYRTGDRASWTDSGELMFAGRADDQVKVRGFRVEPGEIEAVLAQRDGTESAVVVAREDRPGDKRLVAYVVPARAADGAREHVAEHLPEYMVPAAVVGLDELPVTVNGKLDKAALPAPDFAGMSGGRAPANPLEEVLCGLFGEILGLERVGADDSFFDLGGDSLSAMRLIARVRAVLDTEVPVRDLFAARTPAGVARLVAEKGDGVRPPLTRRERPERIPLSFAQQRMWFLNQLEGAAYTMALAYRLEGRPDVAALEEALGDLADRHESLRTVYPSIDDTPYQRILDGRPILEVEDVAEDDLKDVLAERAARPFDLTADLPYRTRLLRLAPDDHVLLLVLHHIAVDGWSVGVLQRDIGTAYAARREGRAPAWEPLPVQYADYALWQRDVLGDLDDPESLISAQLDHWRTALDGSPPELTLSADRPRPPVPSFEGAAVPVRVDAAAHARLVEIAQRGRASMFMVVHAAWALLLARSGAGTDVPVGTATAGRGDAALEDLAGFFINTLVLRTDLSGDPTFAELVARVREADLAAYAHQDVPFERLVDELSPVRSLARNPLFQVSLSLQNFPQDQGWRLPGLAVRPMSPRPLEARFDLSLSMTERRAADGSPDGLDGMLQYAVDLFDEETVKDLAARLARLLNQVAAYPRTRVSRFEILDDAERHRVTAGWNATEHPLPAATLPELFRAQAAATPDAPAVETDGTSWTYRDLAERADAIARALAGRGVGRGDLVGVALDRSPELVATLLGITLAGAGYVPIDTAWPQARRDAVLDGTTLVIDAEITGDGEPQAPGPDDTAYVMFTSGSTGTPKGVVATQRGVAALAADPCWSAAARGRVLFHAPHAFDASTYELWVPLVHGGTVVVAPPGRLDAVTLERLVTEHRLTAVHVTAGLFSAMAEAAPACFGGVREVLTGGDAVPPGAVRRVREACPGVTVRHLYGPTETTLCATTHAIAPGASPGAVLPIGRPRANTRTLVLDDFLRPVPAGVTGELYVAGDGVARGYRGRPALTAERFVADLTGAGGRMYRTGDRARWTKDGDLVFAGRVDGQVKIRGFRVEPGEIEAVLAERTDVGRAVVVVREDGPGKRLVAYVVPGDAEPDGAALRAHLAARLPEYMVPASVVVLDAFPVTANGKIDRAALPASDTAALAVGRGPGTPREQVFCDLFADVLKLERVGAENSFFELGGDSIMSMTLVARARRAGLVITVQQVFESGTPAGLAAVATEAAEDAAAVRVDPAGEIPLTPVMSELVERAGDGVGETFQSMLVVTPADLDVALLARALDAVADRHPVLRARLGDGVLTVPADGAPFAVRTVDAPGDLADLVRRETGAAAARLDPRGGAMLEAVLLDRGAGERGRLLLVLHHLVVDGVSWRVLLPDLALAYRALREGRTPELEPVPVPFRQWALELAGQARAEEAPAWRDLLAGADEPPTSRPFDPARDVGATLRQVAATVPADALLTTVPAAFHAGVDDVLLAALAAALTDWSRRRGGPVRDGFLVDVEGHGRTPLGAARDLSRTVGWFTSLRPARLDVGTADLAQVRAGGDEAGRVVKLVKEQLRAVPGDGLGHGLLRASGALDGLPSPRVGFNYLGRMGGGGPAGPAGDWQPAPEAAPGGGLAPGTPAAHVLEAAALASDTADGARLTLTLAWPSGLLDEPAARELVEAWAAMLTGMAAGTESGGGHTPSDFPLAGLDQDLIDELEAELEGEL
ncbi:Linear gramicidin synthase subunit D [Actinomadura rubteroloni]|uniref:Linear gramicidin synthase subunit D n=1 Tax=Actinomadura rubteroloni TaxID=1926885 RepID=A0A2P4UIZ3_9ACTN|nr:Linear gramicidin synthase subunit D [Actinomadura rubteroloni]